MIVGSRVKERLAAAGMSQAELARRVGVSQPTITNLIHRSKKGSAYLHKVARELRTTAAYLAGEIDDPAPDAASASEMPELDRELVELLGSLKGSERSVLVDMVRAYAGRQSRAPTAMKLPDELTLTAMFRGILDHVDSALPKDELAKRLAELLPTALPMTIGARPDLAYYPQEEAQNSAAKRDPVTSR